MRSIPCLALAALALAHAALPATALAGPVEDGEEALKNGRPALAMKFFKIAVQQDPDDARAWEGYTRASRLAAEAGGGSEPTASGATPSTAPAPTLPTSSGVPVARVSPDGESAVAEVDTSEIATSYLRGKPIFYAEGLKNLIRGRRLRKASVAQRAYEAEKEALTRYYVRKRGGKLAVSATLFQPRLYAYLAALRASKENLGRDAAIEIWEKESDKAFRLIEFYVVMKNLTYEGGLHARPRVVAIDDIDQKVFLEDDRGIRYSPYKMEGPDGPVVRDFQEFTVWFAPVNRDGDPLWENTVSEMRLVIEDIRGEARRIVFPFSKNLFRRMVQING